MKYMAMFIQMKISITKTSVNRVLPKILTIKIYTVNDKNNAFCLLLQMLKCVLKHFKWYTTNV